MILWHSRLILDCVWLKFKRNYLGYLWGMTCIEVVTDDIWWHIKYNLTLWPSEYYHKIKINAWDIHIHQSLFRYDLLWCHPHLTLKCVSDYFCRNGLIFACWKDIAEHKTSSICNIHVIFGMSRVWEIVWCDAIWFLAHISAIGCCPTHTESGLLLLALSGFMDTEYEPQTWTITFFF